MRKLRMIAMKLGLIKPLVKCECVGENSYWQDCPRHEEGCYASYCLMCGEFEYVDCEYWNDRRY